MTSTPGNTAPPPGGPPYLPRVATFGGRPQNSDIAVSSVFLVLFAIGAVTHMSLFIRNKRRGHFFAFSAATFGFCMARITTYIMRIAWAKKPNNINLGIAASVFVSAGVILLFIINMNYAQRILRGYHPKFGNSKPVAMAFAVYYVLVVGVLIAVIVATVVSFFTLDVSSLSKCRNVQRFAIIYFSVFAFLPIPLVLLVRLLPAPDKTNFGKLGTLNQKVLIVLLAAVILSLSTAFRAATAFLPATPFNHPAWYDRKAAFYVFMPTLEFLVVVLYAVTRVDQRFFVDGKAEKMREKSRDKVVVRPSSESTRSTDKDGDF